MKKTVIISIIISLVALLFFGTAYAIPGMFDNVKYLKRGRYVSVKKSESKVYTVLENGVFDSSFEHTVPTDGYSMVSLHTTGIECNFAGTAKWKIGDDIYGNAFNWIHGDEEGHGRTFDNGVSAPEMSIKGTDACISTDATIKVYLRVLGGSSQNN